MSPQKLFTQRVLWAALLLSTFLYLMASFLIRVETDNVPGENPQLIPAAFAVVAVGLAVASLVLPRIITKSSLLQLKLQLVEVSSAERLFTEAKGRGRRFRDPGAARTRALSVLQTSLIIGLACAETIALLGLVLLVQGYGPVLALPFFVVCWALMLGRFPTVAKLERELESAYDADLAEPVVGPAR